ncbi:MAG: hypothetical protein GXO68_05770 [Crenarchaeota archaeon]|nr:hypothetical protein [Thermoproteota archaeon]
MTRPITVKLPPKLTVKLYKLAEEYNIHIAEIIRASLVFFLSLNPPKGLVEYYDKMAYLDVDYTLNHRVLPICNNCRANQVHSRPGDTLRDKGGNNGNHSPHDDPRVAPPGNGSLARIKVLRFVTRMKMERLMRDERVMAQ